MFTHFNGKFQKEVVIIHPGEYYATGEDKIISTVLGSCVGVAFHDRRLKRSGLNHFMLAQDSREQQAGDVLLTESGKYGMYAMELVINEMIKQGSRRGDLVAKVFGGGQVLRGARAKPIDCNQPGAQSFGNVSCKNIDFAMTYLETEGIPIETADVGGTAGRKILVFATTFKVLLKRITGTLITDVKAEENEYMQRLKKEQVEASEPTFF